MSIGATYSGSQMQNCSMVGGTMDPIGNLGRRHMVSTSSSFLALASFHIRMDIAQAGAFAEPDAGIVNFYQTKDTLMGHVDRSEICATSPLVSIS